MRPFCFLLLLVTLSVAFGCGRKDKKADGPRGEPTAASPARAGEHKAAAAEKEVKVAGAPAAKETLPRKIKYTADVKLIVDELEKALPQLQRLVKDHKGFVAQSEESASPGHVRSANYRVRIPIEHFEPFREGVLALGEVEKNTTDSEDVTDEYYDLKNHIKNKLAEEEGLREILKQTGGKTEKLELFLKVNDKLNEVRDYINRQEGRLRVLENLTDLTTITVHLREKRKYDPDKPPSGSETPTFSQRSGRTFEDSWEALLSFGQGIGLFFVALSPWLPVLALLALPAWIAWRRMRAEPAVKYLEPEIVEGSKVPPGPPAPPT